jgi:hypothetical protein
MPPIPDKPLTDSETGAERLAVARSLLTRTERSNLAWPALAAAALFAASATAFAVVTILAPAPASELPALRE